jgi:ankyrin repeat protein
MKKYNENLITDLFHIAKRRTLPEFIDAFHKSKLSITLSVTGQSLLQAAIAYNKTDVAFYLLGIGINVNIVNQDGFSALHYCAEYGNIKCMKAILDSGGDIGISNKHGNQPLWTACMNARGNYECVLILLGNGADIGHVNMAGMSPLDLARSINDKKLEEILMKK